LEQYTRCPRNTSPSAASGSLPNARLCRFKLPTQPQCGHGDCLSKKAAPSTPDRCAQNGMADGTSLLLPELEIVRRAFFLTALPDGGTRFNRIERRGGRR
jgi:hypothetical protein